MARITAAAPVERDSLAARTKERSLLRIARRAVHFAAVGAEPAHEALRDDARERRRQQVRRNAHLEHAVERRDGVLRVDRRHQQVARQRDAHGHRRRLLVADFPEQDARNILAQYSAQPRDERHARLRVDLHLIDA